MTDKDARWERRMIRWVREQPVWFSFVLYMFVGPLGPVVAAVVMAAPVAGALSVFGGLQLEAVTVLLLVSLLNVAVLTSFRLRSPTLRTMWTKYQTGELLRELQRELDADQVD